MEGGSHEAMKRDACIKVEPHVQIVSLGPVAMIVTRQ